MCGLRFDEKPDYTYLRSLFRQLFKREGFAYDYVFDWSQKRMGGDENKVPEKQQQHQKQQLEPDYKYSNYIESSPNMHYQTIESSKNNNNRNATTTNYTPNNYETNPYLPSRNKYGSNNYK